jgi:hypothetical protein
MTSKNWLVVQLGLVLVVAAGAAMWASALMASIDGYRSPFHGRTVASGETIGAPLTRRLVFVYVDGLRVDTAADAKLMPYLNELRTRGATATSRSREPSYSFPGYTTMMSGAWPEFNDGPLLNPSEDQAVTWPQDNLFAAAKRAGLKIGLADHYSAENVIPQDTLADRFYVRGQTDADDRAVTGAALRWLEDGSYQFVVVHLDEVDHAGHFFGVHSAQWRDAARRVDGLVRDLVGALDLTKDTILLTSDHGHIDRGGHGGNEDLVLNEPFILAGAGVKPGIYEGVEMVDIAPTLAALLGTNIPALSQGHLRTDMLQLTQAQGDRIAEVLRTQQLDWVYAYLRATGLSQMQLGASGDPVDDAQGAVERTRSGASAWSGVGRAALVALVIFTVISALWFFREPVHPWHLFGALAYLAAFHASYALIEGRTYSLSSVLSADDIVGACLLISAVAFAVATVIVLWRTPPWRQGPLACARAVLEFALVAMAVVAVPALVGYAVNGAVITWKLPAFPLMFFTFLSLLQLAGIAVTAILAAGVAALAAWRFAPVVRPELEASPSAL